VSVVAYLQSIAWKFLRRSEISDDLEEEILSQIGHQVDDLERSGLSRVEAERWARIEFGARERFKEESYVALGGHFFDRLSQDIYLALRILRRSKGFTVAAILTLALASGANAVVFGITDALLLRPLGVPHVESLYGTRYGDGSGFQSYPNYIDLRDSNRSFEDLACFNFFQNDQSVLGRVLQIDKHPFTIIGVASPEFRGTLSFVSPDFFVPIVNQQQVGGGNAFSERSNTQGVFEVFGHLRSGVTRAEAEANVNAIGDSLQKTYPTEVRHEKTSLGRVGLTAFAGAIRAFVTGLTLLAFMILLWRRAPTWEACLQHTRQTGREKSRCGWRLAQRERGSCSNCLTRRR
jgi:hypothetical protein